jgi:WD40 repeat protein
VAFSPVRNLVAATSEPKVITLYDLDSGRESVLWRVPDPGAWNVWDLSFSPDGSQVVIYAGSTLDRGNEVWVVDVSSSQVKGLYAAGFSNAVDPTHFFGAARLAPGNRYLYLARIDPPNKRHNLQCLDLATGRELWQTEPVLDAAATALAVSPDGRVLASSWGVLDTTIRIWEADTGRLLAQPPGHTGYAFDLAFTRDGRHLISAASDQTIRVWDTSTWTETHLLRGHTDEVHGVAISEVAQLVASTGKDGNLMLWNLDGKSATDGYSRLPESLDVEQVIPLGQSRLLLLPPGQPPGLVDLKHDPTPVTLSDIGASTNVLYCVGLVGSNILCHWNGTNQILVRELRGVELITRGAVTLDSGLRPTWVDYNPSRQLLAWTEGASSRSVSVASLAAPGRRTELRSDVSGLVFVWFSEDGNFLAAHAWDGNSVSVRAWNIETGQIVASLNGGVKGARFAADGRVLVVAYDQGTDHEVGFYDLAHPDREPRRVPGKHVATGLAVSPTGGLVASSSEGGVVRLLDPAKGEWIADLQGQQSAAVGLAFSADGRRLISAHGWQQAVTLWDVTTRQELLTLGGSGDFLHMAIWSADGDVILAGVPWQAWRTPSRDEIAAAEAKEEMKYGQP